jgi:hypothetical protein
MALISDIFLSTLTKQAVEVFIPARLPTVVDVGKVDLQTQSLNNLLVMDN